MKLALGTVQFGLNYGIANTTGRPDSATVSLLLQRALGAGMDTLDTAIAYGDSEAVLGASGIRSWRVVSKLPAVPDGCSDVGQWVRQETLGSLKRLGVDRLYGLLLHRPTQLLESKGAVLYAALRSLQTEGLVAKVGVSVYGPDELAPLLYRHHFDLVQAPLNILDRRLVESGWAQRLRDADVELHTRSAFLQGLLLMPAKTRPAKFDRWACVWQEWDRWLASSRLTPVQACLRYLQTLDAVDRVVVGVDSLEQLDELLEATEGPIDSLPCFGPLQDGQLIDPARWNQL